MKPILFSYGSFHIYSFGLMVALGVMLSVFLMERRSARFGFPGREMVLDFVFVSVLFGFIGARIDYILQNFAYYSERPMEIFAFWEGGLIFYGGVVGAFLGLVGFCRMKKISFAKALDFLLPYIALTHAFGRVGCFFNACCGGKACDLPWAVTFPETGIAVHPVQLYEVALDLILFAALSCHYVRNEKRPVPAAPGATAVFYFFGYGLIRFFMEFFRTGNPFIGPLTINQWFSVFLIIVSGSFYAFRLQKKAN